MFNEMITCELFADLPYKQQDLLVADTDSKLAGSNYVNTSASLQKTITNRHTGSTDNSTGTTAVTVDVTVQVLLQLGTLSVASITALPSSACK
jgi:hypothetical protein